MSSLNFKSPSPSLILLVYERLEPQKPESIYIINGINIIVVKYIKQCYVYVKLYSHTAYIHR